MKFKLNEKYNTIAIYSIGVFVICLLLVSLIFKASSFFPYISKFLSICSPIFIGIAIAYILSPVADFFEGILNKTIGKKLSSQKLFRAVSIFVTFTIVILLIAFLIASIVPELITSIKNLIDNVPEYYNIIIKTVDNLSEKYPSLADTVKDKLTSVRGDILSSAANFETILNGVFGGKGILASITGGAINLLNIIKNILIGMFIAVYLLFSKENFIAQIRKLVFALFSHSRSSKILSLASDANSIFSRFIIGKAIDSIIIGFITFFGMKALNMPYALLLSFIIGITNMIPVFGPFIGAIPSAFLILLSGGINKTIYFCIFIIILQQLDGNVIGPKILGNQLGISAFWIMCSVIIGGGMFGVVGMIIAVPIFAFIHSVVRKAVSSRLMTKNLPLDTKDYYDI